MKILFVIKNLPPDHDPEGSCTAKPINALSKERIDVTILTATPSPACEHGPVEVVPDQHPGGFHRLRRLMARFPKSGLS